MTTAVDADAASPYLPLRETWRLIEPIHPHLIHTAWMSAAAEVAGLVPYLAAVEIARALLLTPDAGDESGTVWVWVAVGGLGAVVRPVLLALSNHVGHLANATIMPPLIARIAGRFGQLPLGWFRTGGVGRVKTAMNDDLAAMHDVFAHAVARIAGVLAGTVFVFGYLLLVDWRLALVAAAVPLATLVGHRLSTKVSPEVTNRVVRATEQLNSASVEYVDGIAVVRVFGGAERQALTRFDSAAEEFAASYRHYMSQHRISGTINRALAAELTVIAVAMAVGVWLMAVDQLAFADFVPFIFMSARLPAAFGPLVIGAADLRTGRLHAANVHRLLELPVMPQPSRPAGLNGHGIEFEDVSFSYDGQTAALDRVSAICEPGTLTALVGTSGAGKTTLASLVPRFFDVSSGAVRVGGRDVRELAQDTLLSSISLVFQDVILIRGTVADNIRLAKPDASREEITAAAKATHVHDVIESLPEGYDTLLGEDRAGLSGGEQQRLTIARAILSAAPIVVMDEATSALDPDSEAAVQDALSALISAKTVLVVAHRLHTITAADQILVLDHGRVAERGTHAELLELDGRYARQWRAQHGKAAA